MLGGSVRLLEGVCVCEAAFNVWTAAAIAAWSRQCRSGPPFVHTPPVAQDDVP